MKTIPDAAVDTIVIHYSATPIEQSFTAVDIDRMHRARGFDKIGYHFFTRRDGTMETGRRIDLEGLIEQGAHVRGHNDHSIGICYEGGVFAANLDTGFDTRTPVQTDALTALIDTLHERFPNAAIVGHRDMPGAATQCPGFDAGAWWKTVEIERSRTWLTRFIASLAELIGRKTA